MSPGLAGIGLVLIVAGGLSHWMQSWWPAGIGIFMWIVYVFAAAQGDQEQGCN